MAINNLETGTVQQPSQTQQTQTQAPKQSTNTFGRLNESERAFNLGFIPGDIKIMNANKASEYTTIIADAVQNLYLENIGTIDLSVLVLDKEVIHGLYYSFILVTKQEEDKIYYFQAALERTGRKPMTAENIIREYQDQLKNNQNSTELWTIDETYNIILRQHAVRYIIGHYKLKDVNPDDIICADGCTIPYHFEDIEQAGRNLAAIAFNALLVCSTIDTGKSGDLNIATGNKQTQGAALHIQSAIRPSTAADEMNNPIRSDWRLELCLKQNKQQFSNVSYVDDLNRENANIVLTKVHGFVDAIPDMRTTIIPGIGPVRDTRMRPHIIITDINAVKPTIGFMLLGFLSSRVMANRNMWLATVLPNGSKYNVGALNLKTCLEAENNPNFRGKPGVVMDLAAGKIAGSKEKMTNDEIYNTVKRIFSLEPIVSIDIPAYGPHTFYMSVLSAAASGGMSRNSQGAPRALIDSIVVLTNGRFDKNFPIQDIFNHEGVLVPTGTWRDKTGALRDIRDVDLTMIASVTGSLELMDLWALSNLPYRVSHRDPYLTKVDIISKIIPGAEITGKAARVTFTSKFMAALDQAAIEAGLNLRYEPELKDIEDSNLGIMEGYFSPAAFAEGPGYARPNVFSGPNYNTPWLSSGSWRTF